MFTITIHQRSANQNVIEIPSPHRTERLSSGKKEQMLPEYGGGVSGTLLFMLEELEISVTNIEISLKFPKKLKLEVS